MRSRAVNLPLAWTFSTAVSPTGCSDSSLRLCSSANLPAVVWMSMVCSAAGSAVWSATLVMGVELSRGCRHTRIKPHEVGLLAANIGWRGLFEMVAMDVGIAMVEWSEEHDVLVAGSGGGGVTGAYTAAREGLDVLLIEAPDRFGGTTAYSGGGGVWFPCNPVLVRAGTDDTIEDALTYYHAVVGDRTPRELQETYVRGGAPLIEYLEHDSNLKFVPLPWPDYYGKAPKARVDGQRHIAAKPLKVAAAPELRDAIRGPLDTDRLGVEPPTDYFVGGRALIARFLKAIGQYPSASLRRDAALVELVVSDGAVVGAIVERGGKRTAIRTRLGVLLAAGGFESNDELRRQYGVPGQVRDTMGACGNRGLALRAGIALGADT